MRRRGATIARDCVAEEGTRKSLHPAYYETRSLQPSNIVKKADAFFPGTRKDYHHCTLKRENETHYALKRGNETPFKREDGRSHLKEVLGYTACIHTSTCGYGIHGLCAQSSTCGHGIDGLLDGPHPLVSVGSLLKRIGKTQHLLVGRQVHHHIVEWGYGWETLLGNGLMHMYGKCGQVEDAQATFDRLPQQDTYSWNTLINVYGHNRSVDHAKSVFYMMPDPNVVSWNAMLTLLTLNGQHKEALSVFGQMQIEGELPNDVTFICVVDACSALASLEKGKQFHAIITNAGYGCNAIVGTALINMYGKCGCLHNARCAFTRLPDQDVVSWTAMIGGLAQNGCGEEALECFQNMQSQGVSPNDITFISALEACANLAALKEGLGIHTSILLLCYEHEIKVGNALIDMYGKCGSLEFAMNVFRGMHQRTLVSWNAIIAALGQHGFGKDALALFWKMQDQGVKPDSITFIAMMNACSHVGLVEDGWCLFFHMHKDHGFLCVLDHYVCIIDLLGRAGRLDEAEEVVCSIPFESTVVAWLCLLAACKLHGDAERGSYAASRCVKLDQSHCAPYIVLSNIYMELVFSELQGH